MTSADRREQQPEGLNRRHLLLVVLALPVYFALFMFLPAGSWTWERGWLFVLVFLSAVVSIFGYLWRVNPEVVLARTHPHQGAKRWDKVLLLFYFPAMWGIVPVAALDDGRFHWFPLPWWICAVGYLLLLIGLVVTTWAEAVNKFFEVTVRIQTDRGQTVIDTGPYAIVRHPGYVGGLFMAAGIAVSLGSLCALIPAGLASLVLILRTHWEDEPLQDELPGYKEYTQRVRYKLIPAVW
jgi:protein-S-isoprenylcysteine O-methyltransferase Ste14